MSLSIPITPQSLSSSKTPWPISARPFPGAGNPTFRTTPIRMGGGPRTYPGGVSRWQWKRMQAKKAKQLREARLVRERQIYEMRKRGELKAAVERPWEAVEKPPDPFSVDADERRKVFAGRVQKPGGCDLWPERDGPKLFRPDNGLPSFRFFPEGVVHSVMPYGKMDAAPEEFKGLGPKEDSGPLRKNGEPENSRGGLRWEEDSGCGLIGGTGLLRENEEHENSNRSSSSSDKEGECGGYFNHGKLRKKGNSRSVLSGDAQNHNRVKNSAEKGKSVDTEVFDMSLRNDGTYGFE